MKLVFVDQPFLYWKMSENDVDFNFLESIIKVEDQEFQKTTSHDDLGLKKEM